MAQPADIENGQIPDAVLLMLWLDWLNDGKGVKSGTYDVLKAYALLSPTDVFDCWATDLKQRMFYTGDATTGDDGFIVLGGA